MQITSKQRDRATILSVDGKIDHRNASELRAAIEDAAQQGAERVLLDLSAVPAMDSSALGALIGGHFTLQRSGGKLLLIDPTPSVQAVLRITRLDTVFEIYATVDSALQSVG